MYFQLINSLFCLNKSLTHSCPKLHRFSFATRFIQVKLSNGLYFSPMQAVPVCLSQSLPTVNTPSVKLSCLDIFTIKYMDIQACNIQRAHVLYHRLTSQHAFLPIQTIQAMLFNKINYNTGLIQDEAYRYTTPQRLWQRRELAHTKCLWSQSARRLTASQLLLSHLRLWKEWQIIFFFNLSFQLPAGLQHIHSSGLWCLQFIHHFYSTPTCLKYQKPSI